MTLWESSICTAAAGSELVRRMVVCMNGFVYHFLRAQCVFCVAKCGRRAENGAVLPTSECKYVLCEMLSGVAVRTVKVSLSSV